MLLGAIASRRMLSCRADPTWLSTTPAIRVAGSNVANPWTVAAIDRAAREGLTIVPLCPFARNWLERHADQTARVAIDWS